MAIKYVEYLEFVPHADIEGPEIAVSNGECGSSLLGIKNAFIEQIMDIGKKFETLERIGHFGKPLVRRAQVHARISIGADLAPMRDTDKALDERIAAADDGTPAESKASEWSLQKFLR